MVRQEKKISQFLPIFSREAVSRPVTNPSHRHTERPRPLRKRAQGLWCGSEWRLSGRTNMNSALQQALWSERPFSRPRSTSKIWHQAAEHFSLCYNHDLWASVIAVRITLWQHGRVSPRLQDRKKKRQKKTSWRRCLK